MARSCLGTQIVAMLIRPETGVFAKPAGAVEKEGNWTWALDVQ